MTAHPGIKEIADLIELPHADDRFLRARTARCSLDFYCPQPEPSLKNISLNVYVLNERVSQVGFPAPEQSMSNRDSFLIESVAQCDVATKERHENKRERNIRRKTV